MRISKIGTNLMGRILISPYNHGCLMMKRRALADSKLLYLLVLPLSTMHKRYNKLAVSGFK